MALMIPILALMIPIVAMMLGHQRRMAEILHQSGQSQSNPELAAIRQELAHLKELLHDQALAIEGMAGRRTAQQGSVSVSERLEGKVS